MKMTAFLIAAAAAALLQDAPPGGKLAWSGDVATAERRSRLEQRPVLLYFTDGGMPCRALDAGAWSSDAVAAAARALLPVLLQCPDEKAHADLRTRFKVTGFPTVIVLEPDGKTFSEMTNLEPGPVVGEFTRLAKKFPGRQVLWLATLEKGLEAAKAAKKPVAIYFHTADADLAAAQETLTKLVAQSRIDYFVWVEMAATNEDNDPLKLKYDFFSLPAVAIIDPRYTELKRLTIFEVTAKVKAKDLIEKIDKALKKYKDGKPK